MMRTVELPLWLLLLIAAFAAVTFASHFLFPSVRWFLRRRAEKLVARLNERLARPIEPFRLVRRQDAIERLSYDPGVMEAVSKHSRRTGVREDVAFETARRYAREIVPAFSATLYFTFAVRVARGLSSFLFEVRPGRAGLAELGSVEPGAATVFVLNHRSNMDYVLVTWLARESGALSYAVGEWARVWPLRGFIRAMGGYFIRRGVRREGERAALYRAVLSRYVVRATQGGVTQAVFPEGGLSLTGGLGTPRLGILGDVLAAGTPVVFVPVAINYDRVLEDRILTEAGREGTRRFRAAPFEIARFTLGYLVARLTRRAGRFGMAAVRFGTPLRPAPGQDAAALAEVLMGRIAEAVPVLPVPLLCAALEEGGAEDEAGLVAAASALGDRLRAAGANVVPGADTAKTLRAALPELRRRGLLGPGAAPGPERDLVAFYAASISHLPRRDDATQKKLSFA